MFRALRKQSKTDWKKPASSQGRILSGAREVGGVVMGIDRRWEEVSIGRGGWEGQFVWNKALVVRKSQMNVW